MKPKPGFFSVFSVPSVVKELEVRNSQIAIEAREGSVNLPPPRDCDGDESRKSSHCFAYGETGRRGE